MKSLVETLQPLGRALMLPIAVLPAAGLLLRLGQPDLLNIPFLAAAGDAVFSNLGLLFAAGVAVGLAREGAGAAALAGVVAFLVATRGAESLIAAPASAHAGLAGAALTMADQAFREAAVAKLSVPIGIICGLIGGSFYNRFSTLKLPEYFAFFGGRRFVPIVSGAAAVPLAAVVGLGYGVLSSGMDTLSRAIVASGPFGLFAFGFLNRLLIVTGLHHVLNNVAFFLVGDYHGVTGDLRRFFAGDPTAGNFMSGFFPVIMFGLPAACLAIYRAARPERRAAVGGMLLSLALTAFLTGVTEPIEFTFMFLAPVLFAIHAVLTGAAMALMPALGIKLGFGFSAGLFDYVLNFGKATRPLLLLPVGMVYALIYYGLFSFTIRRFDLKTPGREPLGDAGPETASTDAPELERGAAFVAALGGGANLASVEACTTRLRLVLADPAAVDEAALKRLGARGVLRLAERGMQVVLGPAADLIAVEIRAVIARGGGAVADPASIQRPQPAAMAPPPPASDARVEGLLAALGGGANVVGLVLCDTRLALTLADPAQVDEAALQAWGSRGVARTPAGGLHLLLGPGAAVDAEGLRERLAAR